MKRRTFLKLTALGLLGLQGCITPHPSDFLRVRGGEVLDARGAPVLLRGFNAGFRDFKTTLGEEDIGRIASLGANCIRLWYEYTDFEAAPFEYRREGFLLLDTILDWCSSRGVYVILCNHRAPGGQNPHDFVVQGDSFAFWEDAEDQERFYALWAELARRYASRKIIAGYDLLNEGVPPRVRAYTSIFELAADAVRSYDENHMLIVEEARLSTNKGQVPVLVPIGDRNTLYSVHFFYPPQFTFYTTTKVRTVTTYPGEMAVAGEGVAEIRTPGVTGSFGWREVTLQAAPPPGAGILLVKLVSRNNTGTIWYDDVQLKRNGEDIDLPAPLISNPSFEVGHSGFNWETEGSRVEVASTAAHTGKRSMMFTRTLHASAQSSPIAAGREKHTLSAWIKAESATGDNYLALSWHKRKPIARLNKAVLEERLRYAVNFKSSQNVPLLVGEFTAHANPSKGSVINYLRDVLDLMQGHGLHWSYWSYYSHLPGIGLYTGNEPRLSRPEVAELLMRYTGQDQLDRMQ